MGIIRNFKKIKIRRENKRDKIYREKRNFILKLSSLFTSSHVFRQPLQQIHSVQYSTMSNTCLQHSTFTCCI